MYIDLLREDILRPLQAISGVVERRQTLPILSNLFLSADGTSLQLITTDLEVQMAAQLDVPSQEPGQITCHARKLLDICKALPDTSRISLQSRDGQVRVESGKSRFNLAVLSAEEFPFMELGTDFIGFSIPSELLLTLLKQTSFAMAQQDVRYYLTGLLLEIKSGKMRAVGTDGHRLAISDTDLSVDDEVGGRSVIVPRKSVGELSRLLSQSESAVHIKLSENHASFQCGSVTLITKLIDGEFPDYSRVIPTKASSVLKVDRAVMKEAITRVSILANEKFRGIRLEAKEDGIRLVAHNPENEEAEESIGADYEGENLVIGFNASYLQDVLGVIESEVVEFRFTDANGSVLVQSAAEAGSRFVIMPMRL